MEKEIKQEWHTEIAKYQTQIHNKEYRKDDDHHHYSILEHEYVVLFNKNNGDYKIIKPDLIENSELNNN